MTFAESTFIKCIIDVVNRKQRMVESAKAFKLRRAYQTLDAVYKNQGAGTNFQQKLGQIEKEAAMQGNGTKSNSIITTENFSISTVDLPGYSSQTSSTSSLPQDISLMKNLEKIYLMRKSRIEGATLANNVNPERVNLFEDLNSSLTLAKQSNPKYEEQRVDNANNNNNSHDVGEDDSSSSDNEYCDALEEFDIEDTLNLHLKSTLVHSLCFHQLKHHQVWPKTLPTIICMCPLLMNIFILVFNYVSVYCKLSCL